MILDVHSPVTSDDSKGVRTQKMTCNLATMCAFGQEIHPRYLPFQHVILEAATSAGSQADQADQAAQAALSCLTSASHWLSGATWHSSKAGAGSNVATSGRVKPW